MAASLKVLSTAPRTASMKHQLASAPPDAMNLPVGCNEMLLTSPE